MNKRATLAIVLTAMLALTAAGYGQSLRVATYNTGLLAVLGSDYVPLVSMRAQRLPAILAEAVARDTPDLLLLEEVWTPRDADALISVLKPLGYTLVRPKPRGVLLGLTSGLLLAVRSPLVVETWSFARFASNTFIENFARKGVLEAVLRTPGGQRIAVVATHTVALDTAAGEPIDTGQVRVFRKQAAQILAALARSSEGGELPAIVLGDFNVGPGYADAEYRILADAPGVVEAGEAASAGDPLVTWDPLNPLVKYGRYPNEPAAKIDHIFLVAGRDRRWIAGEARLVLQEAVDGLALEGGGSPLSDHYGFAAVVTLVAE